MYGILRSQIKLRIAQIVIPLYAEASGIWRPRTVGGTDADIFSDCGTGRESGTTDDTVNFFFGIGYTNTQRLLNECPIPMVVGRRLAAALLAT